MTYKYQSEWSPTQYDIRLIKSIYPYNGRLAVVAYTPEGEPFATFTVCLDTPLSSGNEALAFVDTNNHPNVEKFLKENGLAGPTGYMARSGFCLYPEYLFDLDKLEDC